MDERIESKATTVTFFEDRARVTRVAKVEVGSGQSTVVIAGLTVLVDDSSVVVRVLEGGGRVLTQRVHRRFRTVPLASAEEIDELESDRREKWRELELHRREIARCGVDRRRLVALEQSMLRAIQPVPQHENTDAVAWQGMLDRFSTELDAMDDRESTAVEVLHAARRAEGRAAYLLQQARAETPEIDAALEVELEVGAAGPVTIEIEYFTPCALWRPSHIARLASDRSSMNLRMLGTAWQCTGENWSGIDCRFSTARPTQAAEAPLITDDWLRARPKTEEERRVVQVQARDVDIASTGSELAGQVDQMPGVDDGGEPLTFDSTEPVTIPSNGEPFRVEVQSTDVACKADVVAYPERSTVPFLRARGTWSSDIPILAGPVVVMRGNEYAGRSRIDFVPPGETFELGFGVEGGISVHRTLDDEHKTTAVTGKNILHRTVKVFVSNLSSEHRHLTLIERVPVSEIEEVVVKKVDSAVPPDEDGFVEYAIDLPPRGVETHELAYRVEYGSKVRLSW